MVQIIGKDDTQVHECTCRNCASRLRYTRSEVQSFRHTDYGGGTDIVHYIVCPGCGKQVQGVKH
jgi:hypothetical protein